MRMTHTGVKGTLDFFRLPRCSRSHRRKARQIWNCRSADLVTVASPQDSLQIGIKSQFFRTRRAPRAAAAPWCGCPWRRAACWARPGSAWRCPASPTLRPPEIKLFVWSLKLCFAGYIGYSIFGYSFGYSDTDSSLLLNPQLTSLMIWYSDPISSNCLQ